MRSAGVSGWHSRRSGPPKTPNIKWCCDIHDQASAAACKRRCPTRLSGPGSRGCWADLVVADPDAVVGEGEGHHVVEEGFALVVPLGRREHVRQRLPHQPPVGGAVKRLDRMRCLMGHQHLIVEPPIGGWSNRTKGDGCANVSCPSTRLRGRNPAVTPPFPRIGAGCTAGPHAGLYLAQRMHSAPAAHGKL